MKRLIKKSNHWWEPSLPGIMSDTNKYLLVERDKATIFDMNGNILKVFTFFQLGITNKLSEEDKKEILLNAFQIFSNHTN